MTDIRVAYIKNVGSNFTSFLATSVDSGCWVKYGTGRTYTPDQVQIIKELIVLDLSPEEKKELKWFLQDNQFRAITEASSAIGKIIAAIQGPAPKETMNIGDTVRANCPKFNGAKHLHVRTYKGFGTNDLSWFCQESELLVSYDEMTNIEVEND